MISQSNFYSSFLPTLPPCLPPSVPPSLGTRGISSEPECTECALYHCGAISSLWNSYCLLKRQLMLFPAWQLPLQPFLKESVHTSPAVQIILLPHGSHLSWFPNWRFGVWCALLRGESGLPPGMSASCLSLLSFRNSPAALFQSLKAECPADLVNHSVLCSTSESS